MEVKEKKPKKNWKKILIVLAITIAAFIGVVIIFISPIAKYLVEKYDVKYTGREIKMDRAYVNPFSGYIHFSNLRIYEQNNDSVFFSAEGISANISMFKLLSKTFEISSLVLDQPRGMIVRNKNVFNFADLIEKFSPKEKRDTTIKKDPLHVNILDVEINGGEFYFDQPNSPIHYSIIKVDFRSDGKYWNTDTINGKVTFESGIGSGNVNADFTVDTKTLDYRFAVLANKFNMNVMSQYLKDLANYGNISGAIDADLKGKGNFKDKQSIDANGKIIINNFHFGKKPGDDYVSYEKLTVGINKLAPLQKKYFFDSIRLEHPYFKYERYDHLDNLQNMFGKKGAKIKAIKGNPEKFNLIVEVSKYIRVLFKNFLRSDYKVNSLSIENADIHFNDYSINEKFSVALDPLLIKADSVDKTNNQWIKLVMQTGIKPYGSIAVSVRMDPKTNKDFDMSYKFQKIPAPLFNPYLITYTSFPLDRGTIDMTGNWSIRNDIIQSTNHFLAIDPRLTKKIRKKDARWIPMPLIMAFVRERGNVIDYEIPITGNLKDPKFHIGDVILDLIKNIFVKPPTTPYRLEVKNTENEIEKSLSLSWAMRQTELRNTQEKFINKIVDFLKDNPDANIVVRPYEYEEKEREYVLFFEAKKKYYFADERRKMSTMNEDDSLAIEKMSSKDSNFVKYLDKHIKDSMVFTIQEKCYGLVGEALVNKRYEELKKTREKVFMSYFEKENTEKQLKFSKGESAIPFDGFSYYKINYKGEVPESLKEAFEKLKEINTEPPRDKYLKFRKNKA